MPGRSVSSTRYAMLSSKFTEHFTHRPGAPKNDVLQTLADRLVHVSAGHDIEKPLMRLSVLWRRFGVAFDSEEIDARALLESPHEPTRITVKWIAE